MESQLLGSQSVSFREVNFLLSFTQIILYHRFYCIIHCDISSLSFLPAVCIEIPEHKTTAAIEELRSVSVSVS